MRSFKENKVKMNNPMTVNNSMEGLNQIVMNTGNVSSMANSMKPMTDGNFAMISGGDAMANNNSYIGHSAFANDFQDIRDGYDTDTTTITGGQGCEPIPPPPPIQHSFNTNMGLSQQQYGPNAMPINGNIIQMQVTNGQNWFQNIACVQSCIPPLMQCPLLHPNQVRICNYRYMYFHFISKSSFGS